MLFELKNCPKNEQESGKAKAILPENEELQRAKAERKLREFEPINRTFSSLEAIAVDEPEQAELGKAVDQAKQPVSRNQMNLAACALADPARPQGAFAGVVVRLFWPFCRCCRKGWRVASRGKCVRTPHAVSTRCYRFLSVPIFL
jgi:hypothetical protein